MTLLAATKSQRVEIEYVIEHASRGIRVTAVRPGAETADAPLNGASHA
jgi:NAD(P)-dependent dehydrogenase (short-subunit alcohol dehydrogenase family)